MKFDSNLSAASFSGDSNLSAASCSGESNLSAALCSGESNFAAAFCSGESGATVPLKVPEGLANINGNFTSFFSVVLPIILFSAVHVEPNSISRDIPIN